MSSPFHFLLSSCRGIVDTHTPVELFQCIRSKYPGSCLLESADYRGTENSISYICADLVATFSSDGKQFIFELPDRTRESYDTTEFNLEVALNIFRDKFSYSGSSEELSMVGLFGYIGFNAIPLFETIKFKTNPESIPSVFQSLYRYVIRIDHFNQTLTCMKLGEDGELSAAQFVQQAMQGQAAYYSFQDLGEVETDYSDEEFREVVKKCQHHIQRGDVFQIVPSRQYRQKFNGDEFQVYRALRAINPSPFLFFFDFGSFSIFGSSPEAQLTIKKGKASIFPIAGTYRREGTEESDRILAEKLLADPKESAEHVMLVDLARNDLSKHCENVAVEVFKEVQFYSHVIHLVSKVSGTLANAKLGIRVLLDSFPAGTLSGSAEISCYGAYKRNRASSQKFLRW